MKRDSTVVDGSTFLVTDEAGRPTRDHDGFYHRDVRHLDRYDLTMSSDLETLDVANTRPGERLVHLGTPLQKGARTCHVARRQFVSDGLFESIELSNLTDEPVHPTISLSLGTRFDDLFEVRGMFTDFDRHIDASTAEHGLSFRYSPADIDYERTVSVSVGGGEVAPTTEEGTNRADGTITLELSLAPGETRSLPVAVTLDGPAEDVDRAVAAAREDVRERSRSWQAETDLPHREGGWDNVLRESRENLLELRQETDHGPILSAGVPWFATAFGRDSLIAAYQSLPLTTSFARGTCRYLAFHQATETDPGRDAEPGKILHEIRHGELAARELVPHRPYYGTIDATPLFVVLVHEVWRRTGDDAFLEDLWPAVSKALTWIRESGLDDRGLVSYSVDGTKGDGQLRHVSWKDSNDGVVYPDGTHPSGDLAVAEVQGYAYDALNRGADLAREADEQTRARDLEHIASNLKERFNVQFWLPDEEFYAVGIDGDGTPIPSITTNPGHCLWSGIVPPERADAVVDRLLAPDMFSGWGIRTFAASHEAFNPQSYHLGSVWPHDNSLVALGMARYGRTDGARRVAEGLTAAARARGNDRLPELFAGFDRERTDVPVTYGEACEPQAWAAAAPLACLEAVSNEHIRASHSGNKS